MSALATLRSKYSVNRPGQHEAIQRALYDHQVYPGAGNIPSLSFFGSPFTAPGRNLSETNMEAAGTLPAPQEFLISSIAVYITPTGAVDSENFGTDLQTLSQSGVLTLRVGSKEYVQEGPLNRFPPDTRLSVQFDSGQAAPKRCFAQVVGKAYKIKPILLIPNQNFSVQIGFPLAPVLPSGNSARIGVFLNGTLYRLSQ